MLQADYLAARRAFFYDEGFDGRFSQGLVQRGPYHQGVTALAIGDIYFFTIDHPFIAVSHRGSTDVGRVRTGSGLGNTHGRIAATVFLHLLRGADGADGGVTQAATGHGQKETDITPAQAEQASNCTHVATVHDGALGERLPGATAHSRAAAADQLGGFLHFFRVGVLFLVVLARVGAHHVFREQHYLVEGFLVLFAKFEINHWLDS